MFKRLLVLAVALALFVTVFFIYFHIADAQIDQGFRQEREKFHVQGIPLTSDNPPALSPQAASSEPAAAPASPSASPAAPTSADASTNASVNPNTLIGPVPPPSGSSDSSTAPATNVAPDNTPAPDNSTPTTAPVAPSTAPATPPRALPVDPNTPIPAIPATLIYPGLSRLPLVIFASYNSPRIQTPVPTSATPTVSNPAPAIDTSTNSSSPTNSTSSSPTNAEVSSPTNSTATSTNNSEASSPTNAQPEGETNHAAATTNNVAAPSHGPVTVAASVIVLGYHQFTGPGVGSKNIYSMRQDVFEQEMKYLKDNGYHVVPLSDVVRFIKREIGLPPNSVAVTIDDGYKSAIVWAAPVLKKYGFPWTFFVYPDFITVAEGKGAASWNDLLQLQADGVDIECHSKSHPILTKKGGKSPEQYDTWLTAEMAGAKATLEQHLGKPVKYFAYPYGAYNKEVEAKAVAAGFDAIFTVANNPVHPTTNIDSVGRYIITAPVEKAFASYLRQGALGVADASPAPGATVSDPRPVITAVLGYAGNLDPKTISTDVRDFGEVRHDFDPKTSTIRLYLPRDLIDSVVVVNIRAKDAGQTMIASWRFNYAPAAPSAAHPPIPSASPGRANHTPAATEHPTAAAAHEEPVTNNNTAASSSASNSVSVATNAPESAPATASTSATNETSVPSPTIAAPPVSSTPKK